MRDLHRKLVAAGEPAVAPADTFTSATAEAVRRFQQSRGLVPDGVCGHGTWAALVEAGHRLGDRLLYLRAPHQRGEDVADLQRKLGALGFSAGRVDGILGPETAAAISALQQNAGLTADGICGPDTVAVLSRIPAGDNHSMEMLLERERLRSGPRLLTGTRIAMGGADSLANATARLLRRRGAVVAVSAHRDGSAQAAAANTLDAAVCLEVQLAEGPTCETAYFATEGFTSTGGKRLAEMLAATLSGVLDAPDAAPHGMRLPLLRESRMPAVSCRLGPPAIVAQQQGALAAQIAQCLADWIADPF